MAMEKSRAKIKTNTSTSPPSPSPSRSNTIFTYEAPWQIYAASWSSRSDHPFRIAAASFIEHEPFNRIQILSLNSSSFTQNPSLSFDHPYPPTKLMFLPTTSTAQPDLIASSGDLLRIWAIQSDDPDAETGSCVYLRSVLKSTSAEFSAPLTSFDWNDTGSCNSIATCSIDTTVSVWDLEREVLETQLIAHDKEVYDVAWGEARVFGSVSADGSLRIFDLRHKEHSTIIYESPQPDTPILRLSWNTRDRRYLAAITMDSGKVIVLDIRSPTVPVTVLDRHSACVNAISWAPNSASHLCSAGDDAQALVWQLPSYVGPAGTVDFGSNPEDQLISGSGVDPVLAYDADGEINQLQWSTLQPDWMAIAFGNKLQVLKV